MGERTRPVKELVEGTPLREVVGGTRLKN